MNTGVLAWHQAAWAQLMINVQADRLPHALLLIAPSGSGRRLFAEAFCAYLLCTADSDKPCGDCKQCLLYASGNHPDVMMLSPEPGSKAIKIDLVRRATHFVEQTANQANATKVVIIYPAEAMAQAAANSLLKSLEEPPGKTLFMLIAEPGAALLPTIRSRCQPLTLGGASDLEAMNWLAAHSSAQPAQLQAAVQLATGRPLHALDLLEQGVPAWRAALEKQLLALLQGKVTAIDVAKMASTQPALRAIQVLQEVNANACVQLSLQKKFSVLKERVSFQQKLLPVIRQLSGTANPNELLALEYVLIEFSKLGQGMSDV
jgi:DNA polymerase III subunit delta'